VETLKDLRQKLAPGGCLFVQVPGVDANPFDYLVADHMMHFTPDSLTALTIRAGFAVDCLATTWVTKEISMLARPAPESVDLPGTGSVPMAKDGAIDRVRAQVDWLNRFVESARQASAGAASFGLFGTSIAATWLCGVLGDAVSFFVEEDPHRVGRPYMARPVLRPDQVTPGGVVFMAIVPQIAAQIAARLRGGPIDLRLPPS
jgi:hypothetical protein